MKTRHILLAATLLLAACGSRHEATNLDTTLTLTEDSIPLDVCNDWYWRNIMAVWVDSTGTLSLNHDVFNDLLPTPPPGEEYEYVDDRVPTNLGQLREQVKRFLANRDDDNDLPQKRIEDIPLLGMRPVSIGLVVLHTLESAPEATVDSVRHEIAAAIRAAIPTAVYYSNINRFYKIASDD